MFAAAVRMLGVLTLLTGVLYPLAVTGIGGLVMPHQARGSLIVRDGRVVGSELIGQPFSSPGYFWGRPSATSPPYNGGASSGSNLGPANPALEDSVRARVAALRAADPSMDAIVPVDLVTASASGLDPDISVESALVQIPRVARARAMSEEDVRHLVERSSRGRTFGVLGEPVVRVLELNLALDRRVPR